MRKLLIIDFYALFHRARNAMIRTREFTTSDGVPTTGVFSFVNCLISVIEREDPSHVVVCYDAGGNFRKEDVDYKANRKAADDNFKTEALNLLDEGLYAMGIECVGIKGYEADDSIFTLAHQSEYGALRSTETLIWTCDHDLLQCVTDHTKVLMFSSAKKQTLMGPDEVHEAWGCWPKQIALVKALAGDSSDNISGVKGIGKKTAVKILDESNWSLNAAMDHKKLKGNEVKIGHNLGLVQLRMVWDLGYVDFNDYELGKAIKEDYVAWLQKYEFSQLLKRADKTAKTLKMRSLTSTT